MMTTNDEPSSIANEVLNLPFISLNRGLNSSNKLITRSLQCAFVFVFIVLFSIVS